MHVYGAVERGCFAVVKRFHNLVSRKHPTRCPHQQFQNVELDCREVERLTSANNLPGRRIEAYSADLEFAVVSRGATRRRMARIRASSSRGLNGLGM